MDMANNVSSDGSTPKKQTEQILAVTPILRGQSRTEKNPIPPPHTRSESSTTIPKTTASHPPLQPPPAENDLIDFGQNDGPTSSHLPADLQAAQTQNGSQQQKDLEQTLRSTSQERKKGGSLIDFHDDLKRDLPATDGHREALTRRDTDTSSLDEFVDAEG
jgi:hypothetical protein